MRGETGEKNTAFAAAKFQSTPLMRGETVLLPVVLKVIHISIHSPHARGDAMVNVPASHLTDFNPLPSCEGRLRPFSMLCVSTDFNPLPSCEGRPVQNVVICLPNTISIHSPHARGDVSCPGKFQALCNFNPLPSCEGRPNGGALPFLPKDFNPLPSCEGRLCRTARKSIGFLFQSRGCLTKKRQLLFGAKKAFGL